MEFIVLLIIVIVVYLILRFIFDFNVKKIKELGEEVAIRFDKKGKIKKHKEEQKKEEPETKTCPYCLSEIKYHAIRCPHCTAELEKEKVKE